MPYIGFDMLEWLRPIHRRQIAIGVVIPIVVLALAFTSFLIWRRRRKAKRAAAADTGTEYSEVTQNGQGGVNEFYKPHGSSEEVDGNPIAQLHADDSRQELGSQAVYQMEDQGREPAELDAWGRPLELSNGPSVRRPSGESRP
ncbi:MAG: hypothetical protein LQ338_007979 [Usnochroma carphineum]|nr:MAG: hypothetical protein LQ338_007979 [Usnochroma carphineum]